MTGVCWVNGQRADEISTMDRSVQYGDGFFTTLLVMQGQVYNWQGHWWRLQNSAKRLGFPALVESDVRNLLKSVLADFVEVTQAKKDSSLSDSSFKSQQACCFNDSSKPLAMKLVITRGVGGKGYQPPLESKPNTIVYINPHPQFENVCDFETMSAPIELGLSQTLSTIQPQLAGLKHLNRLENVLARNELLITGLSEALMLNANEEVVCATQSNLFLIKDNLLMTPNLAQSGVAGTTRLQISQLAEGVGLDYQESSLTLGDCLQADELFLTNALRGVMPVNLFQQRAYSSERTLAIHQAWVVWQAQNRWCLMADERVN